MYCKDETVSVSLFSATSKCPMNPRSWSGLLQKWPEVEGITRPMVYVPSPLALFCSHVEDLWLSSMSYLSGFSAPRLWLWTRPCDREALERHVMQMLGLKSVDEAAAALADKTIFLNPYELVEAGISVFYGEQVPDSAMSSSFFLLFRCFPHLQFISFNAPETLSPFLYSLTSPGAYHWGYASGPGWAESVNYAAPSWLDIAAAAYQRSAVFGPLFACWYSSHFVRADRYRVHKRIPEICFEEVSFAVFERLVVGFFFSFCFPVFRPDRLDER
jgi:hypothetical protein